MIADETLSERLRGYTVISLNVFNENFLETYDSAYHTAESDEFRWFALRKLIDCDVERGLGYIVEDLGSDERELKYRTSILRDLGYIGSEYPDNMEVCKDKLIGEAYSYIDCFEGWTEEYRTEISNALFFAIADIGDPDSLLFLVRNRAYFNAVFYGSLALEKYPTLVAMLQSDNSDYQEAALCLFTLRPYSDLAAILPEIQALSESNGALLEELVVLVQESDYTRPEKWVNR